MISRLGISVLYGLTIIPFFFLKGNWYYYLTIWTSIIMFCSITEYFDVIGMKKTIYNYIAYIFAGIAVAIFGIFKLSMAMQSYYMNILIILMILVTTLVTISNRKSDKKYGYREIAFSFFGYIYTIIMPIFILKLTKNATTTKYLSLLFILVPATDSFAYIVGKRFGKKHLTEISPKKTYAGAIGGTIMSVICGVLALILMKQSIKVETVIILAMLSIISQVGDLLSSLIKRAFEKKDFSHVLQSHGGVLDRVDALIFTAPILYILRNIL